MKKVALIYPRGTYKSTPFYFRGGDGLHENEQLQDDLKRAQENYKKARKALSEARQEYESSQLILDDLDSCACKVASNIGSGSTETTANSMLKLRIKQLQAEIEEVEKEIEEARQPITSFEYISLQNEYAQFGPDLEELRHQGEFNKDNSIEMKKKIGEILLSPKFSESVEALVENQVASDCRNRLRSLLSNKTNDIYQQKSSDSGKINHINDSELMEIFDIQREADQDLLESELRLNLARMHRYLLVKMEVDRISEMNEFLTLMQKDTIVDPQSVFDACMEEEEFPDEEDKKAKVDNAGSKGI